MKNNFWKNKNVLVTGGNGFIGSFIIEELAKREAIVTAVSSSGDFSNLVHIKEKIKTVTGDLTNESLVQSIVRGKDFVFHLASLKKNIKYQKEHPASILKSNILMTANILDAAVQNRLEKVLITSSAVVNDDFYDITKPQFGYGWSKKVSEILAEAYHKEYGLKVLVARPHNTYGPRDNFNKESTQIIPSFIERILKKENPFVIWGSGQQKKSFVYVEDLAEGLINFMGLCDECRPVEFSTDEVISVNDLALKVMKVAGIELMVEFDTSKPVGPDVNIVGNRICGNFEFKSKNNLETGLKKTIEWYKSHVIGK